MLYQLNLSTPRRMKYCVMTLGCKVNQYESQAMESVLASRGHTRAAPGDGCDVCIVNTCAVTAESARKSRQAVRRAKKAEPGALIAVCGCLTQLDPVAAAVLGADLVGGSGDRLAFALEIERRAAERRRAVRGAAAKAAQTTQLPTPNPQPSTFNSQLPTPNPQPSTFNSQLSTFNSRPSTFNSQLSIFNFEDLPPGPAAGRTRALLKIQDGCDNFCAYCIIPYARGRSRSLPVLRAAEYAGRLESEGYREIVVTGVEISSYSDRQGDGPTAPDHHRSGAAAPTPGLADVVRAISEAAPVTHGLADVVRAISEAAPRARLRLGSLDPRALTDGFCNDLGGIKNLCPHFHLSLQSGCDDTLRRMGRKYGTATAFDSISGLRRLFPGCGVTADLIAGFPGETEREFAQTLDFIKACAFSDMHVFPFSPRPGTRAADMPGQVEKRVCEMRAKLASAAASVMAADFRRSLVGKAVDVLFERERGGYWLGHTGSYVEVAVKNGGARNELKQVIIECEKDGIVYGSLT